MVTALRAFEVVLIVGIVITPTAALGVAVATAPADARPSVVIALTSANVGPDVAIALTVANTRPSVFMVPPSTNPSTGAIIIRRRRIAAIAEISTLSATDSLSLRQAGDIAGSIPAITIAVRGGGRGAVVLIIVVADTTFVAAGGVIIDASFVVIAVSSAADTAAGARCGTIASTLPLLLQFGLIAINSRIKFILS